MKPGLAPLLLAVAVLAGCGASGAISPSPADAPARLSVPHAPLAEEICRRISGTDAAAAPDAASPGAALSGLYLSRACRPLWYAAGGLSASGRELVDRLALIEELDPGAVPASPGLDAAAPAAAELRLSAAFISLAVDPAHPELRPGAARIAALAELASADPALLRRALPTDPQIYRLRHAIDTYGMTGESDAWSQIAAAPALRLGDRDARVALLRERLRTFGDVGEAGSDPDLFDPSLDAGLRRFQARHGLAVDGIAAKETFAALDVSPAQRIASLKANLQRHMNRPREWGPRYIAVNIPAAKVMLVDGNRVVLERRAIVGRPSWRTPELDSVIDRLDFNPPWLVPASIARQEVLPKIRKDPGYLERNGMRIVGGQVSQAPGPRNPLGKVKFAFDNPYSVYLHDTNAPGLFDRTERFLSHGCVRVEQALDLARRLLAGDPDWPEPRIAATIAAGKTLRVDLKRPIPVHIVYDTAWVEADGTVNFRPDVYGRDLTATAALPAPAGYTCGG